MCNASGRPHRRRCPAELHRDLRGDRRHFTHQSDADTNGRQPLCRAGRVGGGRGRGVSSTVLPTGVGVGVVRLSTRSRQRSARGSTTAPLAARRYDRPSSVVARVTVHRFHDAVCSVTARVRARQRPRRVCASVGRKRYAAGLSCPSRHHQPQRAVARRCLVLAHRRRAVTCTLRAAHTSSRG